MEEGEEILKKSYNVCNMCNADIPENGYAKVHRSRQCGKCTKLKYRQARKNDAQKVLFDKLHDSYRKKKLQHPCPKSLVTLEVVEAVYERCGKKCVLTGETNHKLLCITYKKNPVESSDDLVLVASSEAHRLGQMKDEDREREFEGI